MLAIQFVQSTCTQQSKTCTLRHNKGRAGQEGVAVWHENQMLGTVRLARAAKGKEGWCRTSILFCVGLKLESKGDGEAGGGVNLRTSGRGAGERHLRLTEVSAWMSLCVCWFLSSFILEAL